VTTSGDSSCETARASELQISPAKSALRQSPDLIPNEICMNPGPFLELCSQLRQIEFDECIRLISVR